MLRWKRSADPINLGVDGAELFLLTRVFDERLRAAITAEALKRLLKGGGVLLASPGGSDVTVERLLMERSTPASTAPPSISARTPRRCHRHGSAVHHAAKGYYCSDAGGEPSLWWQMSCSCQREPWEKEKTIHPQRNEKLESTTWTNCGIITINSSSVDIEAVQLPSFVSDWWFICVKSVK